MKKLAALILAMMLVMSSASLAFASEEKINLVVWSFTDELEGILNTYYKPAHPEVEITYVLYSTEEFFQTAFPTMMAATPGSAEAPDVFALEADYAKEWINSDHTAALTDIGFTEDEMAASVPSVVDFGRDPDGVAKALSWQSTPGALFYRASLAKEYLDADTPEEFQEMVSDWDTFFETAEEVNDASEGKTKLFNSIGDIYKPFFYQREAGWVQDGKLVIDPAMLELAEYAKMAKEDGLYNLGEQWQETWFAGMKTDATMAYFLPTWGLHYTLKPNSGGEKPGEGTYGDWRMVAGPVGYSWGGTWLAANATKVAAASEAKKAAIKELINYITLDYDFLKQYAKESGDFVSNIQVAKDVVAEGGTPNDFLGGQDHYAAFAESSMLISDSTTGYDGVMNGLFQNFVLNPYLNGEIEMDDAIENFKNEVRAAYSDIVVE
ncbi:MAG: carbohydrate ABC transporter substrate-binding protein [Clostridiales bacterium]|nr:carbohydrate ABC transporter substrate-binding protein [Clostridiales bacterium]